MENKENIDIIKMSEESTVVAKYIPIERTRTKYQTEEELEEGFIKQLTEQGYEYINIKNENDLIKNLRKQLEKLNDYTFFDTEWDNFFNTTIANGNEDIINKTERIQENYIQAITLENGYTKNIKLIDKDDIYNNNLQVINQYKEESSDKKARYDVTILINGLPMVHIELKRRGVNIREAFNQINRYGEENFWAGSGLYQYVQLFVISNGTNTKYYSNTTRYRHIKNSERQVKTSNTFEFTSFWADAENKIIPDLVDFTKTFFSKFTLLNILTKYCVFTSDKALLVMRPYQIAAAEKIINKIILSENHKIRSKKESGGYIWHTTGSGKTLTSFKTATLARSLHFVDKVLFVVDRKDLDYQTMKEYDKFQKGAANSNTSTKILKEQLEKDDVKIIITTIQKLSRFIQKNENHEVYKKHIVMIFDECHRSQFGEMNDKIKKAFKNYNIFGFTGTPIFKKEKDDEKYPNLKTTENAFGEKLHTYTIVDAIRDKNVLPFRIDYINTVKEAKDFEDKKVKGINTDDVLLNDERIRLIVKYIIEHFDQKTYRNSNNAAYSHDIIVNVEDMAKSKHNTVAEIKKKDTVKGFNSIFAVSSIKAAKKYYKEFQKQISEISSNLKVATIFSFVQNDNNDNYDDTIQEENFEPKNLDEDSREFLESAIKDYNQIFETSYDTSDEKFENYYRDVSLQMKNNRIDILIVVNMFLTGFDAPTLNTLWVDKRLKMHGLIQAFSRTNRILNSVKTFGNIVSFMNLEENTNKALSVFGDKDVNSIALLKTYKDYFNGYDENGEHVLGYTEIVDLLKTKFPINEAIVTEEDKKLFIKLFGDLLKIRNTLSAFDSFREDREKILSDIDFQDYSGKYSDLYTEITQSKEKDKNNPEIENIQDDVVFEIELIKQVEVNIDYILLIVVRYKNENKDKDTIIEHVRKLINAGIELRSKRELIENFINQMNASDTDIQEEFYQYVKEEKEKDLIKIIKDENLKEKETNDFITSCFEYGEIRTSGTDIDKILPPISRFSKQGNKIEKKQIVVEKLQSFFEKYSGLI
ncbi:type I restriction endonuclease subunit R [Brachyspira hyodysenteriae]|uniref:type I restriction endonuclease subunit R n=1 Tax=Brachyspira hyodysenteriae TaxID=159 RepID=UPI001183CC19|nr:type I restriction endonuclease subunit R [Brachyspira hyodysenteriae]TVL60683.1 DEAD/DEAH box helicase [Brachyspira hyodysenteriae]TVL79832.1 DEAD/DEAH box helicase [Brachyspira hyodysenteriae]